MKRYLLIIFMLSALRLISSPVSDFNEANVLYEKGDYENSIKLFEKIISGGNENGEIYYNLGNAYYKTGDIVKCILNYERALKFMPGDQDLVENLKIARLSLVDKIDEPEDAPFFTLYTDFRNGYNIYSVSKMFYMMLIITSVLISLYILLKNTPFNKLLMVLSVVSVLIFLVYSYVYYDIGLINSKRSGLISEDKVSVLSSPDENVNSKELFYLHRGTKAQIIRSNEEWFEISLDEDKKGWIKKGSLIEI